MEGHAGRMPALHCWTLDLLATGFRCRSPNAKCGGGPRRPRRAAEGVRALPPLSDPARQLIDALRDNIKTVLI